MPKIVLPVWDLPVTWWRLLELDWRPKTKGMNHILFPPHTKALSELVLRIGGDWSPSLSYLEDNCRDEASGRVKSKSHLPNLK